MTGVRRMEFMSKDVVRNTAYRAAVDVCLPQRSQIVATYVTSNFYFGTPGESMC